MSGAVQLRVGDLARRTGLTVRTLHHYDEIGLLRPSGRSESGYRLYSADDVTRLHGIQALRQLGLSLAEIRPLLEGEGPRPEDIVRRQLGALDQQIAHALELRAKLALIGDNLAKGTPPPMQEWIEAVALMTTFGKYFSATEIEGILAGWRGVEDEWFALMAQVRAAMDAGVPADGAAIQPLVRRWMGLVQQAMGGDFALMRRWEEMYAHEPFAHGRKGAPPADMIAYIQRAVEVRLALMRKYLTQEEIERTRPVPEAAWQEVQDEGARLMAAGAEAGSPEARALARRWLAVLDQLCGEDPTLRTKMLQAHAAEPLLAAGSALAPDVRAWLTKSLDPHAT